MLLLGMIGLLVGAQTLSAKDDPNTMSDKELRAQARFLADKIAYEVDMDKEALAATFEINYDFLKSVYAIADKLVTKDPDAVTQYYLLLDQRNGDLVWLMESNDYVKYLGNLSLYRPFQLKDGQLTLRIADRYPSNKNFKGKPKRMSKYKGEHARSEQPNNESYYKGKFRHTFYGGQPRLLNARNRAKLAQAKRDDFSMR
jgi:hypothetical protein